MAAGKTPLFGLGDGMGYADPELAEVRLDGDGRVALRLRNAAGRPGKAVVQVYGRRAGEDFVSLLGHATTVIEAGGEAQACVTPTCDRCGAGRAAAGKCRTACSCISA